MFRRSNFTSACKNYLKYVDNVKTKLQAESSSSKLSSDVIRKFENVVCGLKGKKHSDTLVKLNKFKSDTKCKINFEETSAHPDIRMKIQNLYRTVQSNKVIQSAPEKCKQTISVLHQKLDSFSRKDKKSKKSKINSEGTFIHADLGKKIDTLYKIIKTIKIIQSNPEIYRKPLSTLQMKMDSLNIKHNVETKFKETMKPLFTGAALFGINSNPVTISGYDSQILHQLGIVDSTNTNVQPDTSITNPETVDSHLEITNQETTLNSPNFPPSLFDTQNNYPYQSIFDNMPPEEARNDIYTMIYNTFNSQRLNSAENYQSPTEASLIQQQNTEALVDSSENYYNPLENETFTNNSEPVSNFMGIHQTSSEMIEETVTGEISNDVTNRHLIYTIDKDSTLTDITNIGGGDGVDVLTNKIVTSATDTMHSKINETMTNTTNESVASVTNVNTALGDGAANINLEASGGDCGQFNIVDNPKINSVTEPVVEAIPEPPPVPDIAAELASQLNALGEPSFASLGLGGWTPIGIVQNCFEYLHVTLGIPWWEAVAIGTLIIRFMMFPLVVIAQRNGAKMNNYLPQMQVIQMKMTEARQTGNQLEVARYSQELMAFMKEKNVNPLKNMIVPLAQMPVFVSFFVGLRQMANVPVESLRTGGLFWFEDLTVPDQFFALPVITSLTLWATIELGTDSAKLSSQNLQTMKYVLRALPFVILPFTVNFPGVILCYWVSSNFISLAQVGFLKIPAVRDYFKIDPMLKHDPGKLPVKQKGFIGGIKESWTNIKITKELEERRRLDELQFQKAGKGPLVKTYKYDPTKQVSIKGPNAISAKNK